MTESKYPPRLWGQRKPLPTRRESDTRKIRSVHLDKAVHITTSEFRLGIAEVFVNGAKIGSDMEGMMREWATLLSTALQYGMPLSAYAPNVQREPNGEPSTVFGEIVDELVNGDRPKVRLATK